MIKNPYDIHLLCQNKDIPYLTFQEIRLIIFNYIYNIKGIEVKEVFTVPIISSQLFTLGLKKAHTYFKLALYK